jgi:uncharacterized damage-inducible protein DinB
VPADKLSWAPHEKSMTLGRLAGHVAELPGLALMVVTRDEFDAATIRPPVPPAPPAPEQLLAQFDESAAALREAMAGRDVSAMSQSWTLRVGERVVLTGPRGKVLRSFGFSHLAHHRGQLTVYLRLLDAPVPGLYGPSADER